MHKVALAGAGGIGKKHLDCYRQIDTAQVVAVIEPGEEAAEAARRSGYPVFASLDEAIKMTSPDILDITAPTPFHKDLTMQGLKAGMHILLEKPMARTLEDCDAIIRAVEDSGRRLMVGHVLRFFPEFVRARGAVLSGEVGNPAMVRTSRGGAFPGNASSWYADLNVSGGVLLDLVIHDFDWLRWTFGEVERVFSQGLAASKPGARDYSLTSLRFTSGVIAHVEGTWMRHGGFRASFEVAGDKGLLQYDSRDAATLAVASGQTQGLRLESPLYQTPQYRQITHFLNCLLTGEDTLVSMADAREAVRISLAALESVKTGKPVTLAQEGR